MIKKEINGKVITIRDEERQKCEIWSRVMGYYRPVSDFNIGKKQEFKERKFFKIPPDFVLPPLLRGDKEGN